MYKNKKIFALIPARYRSKRLPKKNIKLFHKRPLLYWSIKVAKKSKFIDDIYVTTDDHKIKKIAQRFGAKVPFLRSEQTSKDKSKSEEFIIEFLKKIKIKYDYVILLQPTSPLRKIQEVEFGIKKIVDKNYMSFVSKTKKDFTKIKKYNSKKIQSCLTKYIKNRKYLINGSIYVLNIRHFLNNKKIIDKKTKYFETDIKTSIDIDNKDDFELAKKLKNYETKLSK